MKKNRNLWLLTSVLVVSFLFFSYALVSDQDASISGTWTSESDPSWKMEFDSNHCNWFVNNEPAGSFTFVISNTSPQCGYDVPTTNNSKYISLTKSDNADDVTCYEIYALSDTTLTLRAINSSGFLVFNRQ